MTRRTLITVAGSVLAAVIVVVCIVVFVVHPGGASTATSPSSQDAHPSSVSTPQPYATPDSATVASLPEAKYSAVIPGLIGYRSSTVSKASATVYSLVGDSALYGSDRITPVAKLPQQNFLLQPTVVVPVRFDGAWALVLTPSRSVLPSKDGGDAPAQTAAWIRRSQLTNPTALTSKIVISSGGQTLSIEDLDGTVTQKFSVGVGTSGAPTPTGVQGYLQERYLDPTQGQAVHPIQLTSLHSSAADEPYEGSDGGLIGIHFNTTSSGAVSHGCVRLDATAITAVNGLPLGTSVVIVP